MSKYILDMTEAKDVPECFGDDKVFNCCDGEHLYQFDVDMNDVSDSLVNAVEKFKINKNAGTIAPIGFNMSALPIGSTMTKIA